MLGRERVKLTLERLHLADVRVKAEESSYRYLCYIRAFRRIAEA